MTGSLQGEAVRRGSSLAMDVSGVPLGLLTSRFWARDGEKTAEKESRRWVETVREVRAIVPEDTRVVVIGDRESDIFAVFSEARAVGADVLVRATHNRKLADGWPDLPRHWGRPRCSARWRWTYLAAMSIRNATSRSPLHAQEVQLHPQLDLSGANPVQMTVVSASEIAPRMARRPLAGCCSLRCRRKRRSRPRPRPWCAGTPTAGASRDSTTP
ncbi:MAG: hypothetical protein M0Z66_09625 [Thermaerobacter sp.]|nr:hypothetical protein [Thermaerobacter sp.]